jgi:hypothetical protein
MSFETYEKKIVALTQLETALRLYLEGIDYFSVITLAGAAEEIFGRLLDEHNIENSLGDLKKSVALVGEQIFNEQISEKSIVKRANFPRNSMKHIGSGEDTKVSLDVVWEAKYMLDRAIDNYFRLEEDMTPAMCAFKRKVS